jgi:hypothetical protein
LREREWNGTVWKKKGKGFDQVDPFSTQHLRDRNHLEDGLEVQIGSDEGKNSNLFPNSAVLK